MRPYIDSTKSAFRPSLMMRDLQDEIKRASDDAKKINIKPEFCVSDDYFKALQAQVNCFNKELVIGDAVVKPWKA